MDFLDEAVEGKPTIYSKIILINAKTHRNHIGIYVDGYTPQAPGLENKTKVVSVCNHVLNLQVQQKET